MRSDGGGRVGLTAPAPSGSDALGAAHAYELYVMSADGSSVRRLTHNGVWDLEPDWR